MNKYHISFFLDQAYGNVIPSFGIAIELLRRGHKVTYVVSESFIPLITSIGATPIPINFLEVRGDILAGVTKENDHLNYRMSPDEAKKFTSKLINDRTRHALSQVDRLLCEGIPNLIIHDDSIDMFGRTLALQMRIPKVRLITQCIQDGRFSSFADDELLLITIPKFFQRNIEEFESDPRFKFVGFLPEGRTLPFKPGTGLRAICQRSS